MLPVQSRPARTAKVSSRLSRERLAAAMEVDVTKLDCFRYCRFLRHVGKVGKLGAGAERPLSMLLAST